MFKREIEAQLLSLSRSFPVVTITGPRQSGKTTLVKHVFKDKPYANLEHPETREFAEVDPVRFLSQFPEGAVLDEIQRVPLLLSYIQVIVDEKDIKGMFILTGSHQMELHQAVSQSLAGRTVLLELLPMSLTELQNAGITLSIDDALLLGGYPRIFKENLNPTIAYGSYFKTYVERDLRQLILVKDLGQFQRFIRLCAGRIGQLLNLESLSNEVGVSSHTIKHWLSILEASFIIFRLQPYHENIGKRLVKSPKLFFTDVGLASYLLGIESTTQMSRDPQRGHLFENLIVLELMKARLNRCKDPNLYFFRDTQGHEVDIIFKVGHELFPIEVKSTETFHRTLLKNLDYFSTLMSERVSKGYLVYGGKTELPVGAYQILNYQHASTICE